MANDNILSIKLIKKDGKLKIREGADSSYYKNFVNNLEEGQIAEAFFDSSTNNGSKAQLAMIHACIKKLASEIGYTFEEMKLEIKAQSGLAHGDLKSSDGYVKSFADCSKEELSNVIETIKQAGTLVNIVF
tara:strand:- start:2687 stop:3079 length:393 start_codon:yes stop_codon:yes gene_type:complete